VPTLVNSGVLPNLNKGLTVSAVLNNAFNVTAALPGPLACGADVAYNTPSIGNLVIDQSFLSSLTDVASILSPLITCANDRNIYS
jgi:hypothetical protein